MITGEEPGQHYNPSVSIDTLAMAKRLHASGVPRKQAETQVKIWNEIVNHHLPTKSDIETIKHDITDMRNDITNIHSDITYIRNDIYRIEQRLDNCADKNDLLGFATKKDLENFATKNDLENLKKDIELATEKVKSDILKWIVPIIIGQPVLLGLLAKFFNFH